MPTTRRLFKTYVDDQIASNTIPWFSKSDPDGTGYRYIGTGPAGLVLRSGPA
jgi:hypothetical protein